MSEEGKRHANELAARLRQRDSALEILQALVSEFDQVYDVDDGRPNIPDDIAELISDKARMLLAEVAR